MRRRKFIAMMGGAAAGTLARAPLPQTTSPAATPKTGALHHQAGGYIGKILKGASPADMPVMQSTHFELVLNLRSAKRLQIAVPPTFLATVDEIIE
jgi:hypothetical protein